MSEPETMRRLSNGIVVDQSGHYYFSPSAIAAAAAALPNLTGTELARELITRALDAEQKAGGSERVGEIIDARGRVPFLPKNSVRAA